MKKVLILFAHPKFEQSRSNKALLQQVQYREGVTVHDLYEEYPHFHIDVEHEKSLLQKHDIIIWQHPLYWYSCPALMKQWIDLVLEFGWAYGEDANALKGKTCFNVITTGASREVYCSSGTNGFSLNEFLRPFEQTAKLCEMEYLPPYALMGTHTLNAQQLKKQALGYGQLLDKLIADQPITMTPECEQLTDAIEAMNAESI